MESLPDFVNLAESYGHVGFKIEKPSDVEPILIEAFKMREKLVFMDFFLLFLLFGSYMNFRERKNRKISAVLRTIHVYFEININ